MQADLVVLVAHLLWAVEATLLAVRGIIDFVVEYIRGSPPGEASCFLNVRIANRALGMKQSAGAVAREGLNAALSQHAALSPISPLLADAWGELVGNVAAFASRDVDIAHAIGTSLAAALGRDEQVAKVSGTLEFASGPIAVVRVQVSVTDEHVCAAFEQAAGAEAVMWCHCLHRACCRLPVIGPQLDQLARASMRTIIAKFVCRQLASIPTDMLDGLQEQSGMHIRVRAQPLDTEASFLFDELRATCSADPLQRPHPASKPPSRAAVRAR